MRLLTKMIISWFGCGLLPGPKGTYGTAGAIVLYLGFIRLENWAYVLSTIALYFMAVYFSQKWEDEHHIEDDGRIVIDEVLGFVITMFLVPFSWTNVFLGFLVFRVFDIVKPFPVRWIDQKVGGGLGVVSDDALAGVYSCLTMHALLYWGKAWF